jgi:two-component system NarL family sensor kinase
VIEERDQERLRIARALHDEIGQLLTAAGFHLDAFRRELPLAETTQQRMAEVQHLFDEVLSLVRGLTESLPATSVDRLGLALGLERLVAQYRLRYPTTVRLMVDPRSRASPGRAHGLYRLAELALAAALEHSGASLIEVLLRPTARGLALEVRDNGPAPVTAEDPRSVRLLLARQVADANQLNFSFIGSPGAATIVSALDAAAPRYLPPEELSSANVDPDCDR